jgi:hypothetical protein
MGIRTTVTLDEDVLERVKEQSRTAGKPFREMLNDLVRQGLLAVEGREPRAPLVFKTKAMGPQAQTGYDDTEALLEYAEGQSHL